MTTPAHSDKVASRIAEHRDEQRAARADFLAAQAEAECPCCHGGVGYDCGCRQCDSCGEYVPREDVCWRRVEVRSLSSFEELIPFCATCAAEMRRAR